MEAALEKPLYSSSEHTHPSRHHALLRCLRCELLLPPPLLLDVRCGVFCPAAAAELLPPLPARACCPAALCLSCLTDAPPRASARLKPAYTHRNATMTMGGRGIWLPCSTTGQVRQGMDSLQCVSERRDRPQCRGCLVPC